MFDRKTYFDAVRKSLFYGSLNQGQVDGQNALLSAWEENPTSSDLRHFAYMLATTIHETASTMRPIAEYGKGSGHDYGKPDPETGQAYYGRGYVQLTWRDNYARADRELGLTGDQSFEWHADNALDPTLAAYVMFRGMDEGWFRGDSKGRKNLSRYFNDTTNDPVNARDIINGDISKNGPTIAGYHNAFLAALEASWTDAAPEPEPVEPDVVEDRSVLVSIDADEGVSVRVLVNGGEFTAA